MALFQKAVLNKFLSGVDENKVEEAWAVFSSHFHNKEIQENIRNCKEEAYQEGFLDDLFVKVLGYTKNPTPGYNLVVEQKNLTDSKKADGALLDGDKVRGVIELKGTETTDLSKVEPQAFGYKNKQPDATYVVISNFEKLRFYIDNAVDFLEFNLFQLPKEEFKVLWLCLSFPNFSKELPKRIKDASLTQEEDVTKKLYSDYSDFKHAVFESIKKHNPEYDQLLLFKKTQKLLDRFLFIFFAEDRLLLPPNSIREIIKQWMDLRDNYDAYVPLYDRFKKYFGYMRKGHKGKNHDIFAYNGGLFAKDKMLDSLEIDDEILYKHTSKLSNYDFESEVDVNILGHIFEHSLSEIEEINAELKSEKVDTSKSRRKKEGVFYTPKYITKYIVEHTLDTLCEEKKAELDIIDERFTEAGRRTQKGIADLKKYREWLLSLTICDPACGSGAFLNQALEFLIAEHKYIDELQAKYHGESLVLSDIQNQILEKNLFGVDINEESIEIAKLSLWLRTAQKGRKLTSLNNNIKCGNSLINDSEVAGDKAFNWQTEFPDVFAKGGFDMVIGNPPYGAKLSKNVQDYLNKTFIKGGSETAISFIRLSYDLIKNNGALSFIIPKSFSYASNYQAIREFTINDIEEIVDCGKVWNEVKLEQVIFSLRKKHSLKKYKSSLLVDKTIINIGKIDKESFKKYGFYLNGISDSEKEIGDKIWSAKFWLKEIADNSRGGTFQKHITEKGEYVALGGAEIQRHGVVGEKGRVDKYNIQNEQKSFIQPNSVLVQNIVAHIKNPTDHIKITACLPENRNYVIVDTINQIAVNKKFDNRIIWYLLNSDILNWYAYRFIFGKAIRTMHFDNAVTDRIPIPDISKNTQNEMLQPISKKIELERELEKTRRNFTELLFAKIDIEKLSRKLENWHMLTFKQFLKELKKKKIKLSLDEEAEWLDYFNAQKAKADDLKTRISQTDSKIDRMVYELYGLSEEEKKIIERE